MDQIEIIDRSCRYLLELSDLIFIPVKAIKERLIDIDVYYHLDNTIKHALIPDDINIVAEYRNKKITIAVGNSYLTEAFLEIIVNAVEAMEDNSSKEKKITIDVFTDNDMIKIIFSDTGKGIKQEEKDGLFNFFSKKDDKKNQRGHKGFGLWLIKNFLEKYINGKVDIEPRLNETDFIVFLPIKK